MNHQGKTQLKEPTINLRDEVKLLRSFMIGITGRDKEGSYRPDFVKRVLALAKKKTTHVFKNEKTLLKEIHKNA